MSTHDAVPAPPAAPARVRFVVVPLLPVHQPALGVSSLLSVLRREGFAGDISYLNLEYGGRLGWDLHTYLTSMIPTSYLPGEMLFSRALWGDAARPFEDYAARIEAWLDRAAAPGSAPWKWMHDQWLSRAKGMRAAIEDAPTVIAEWADRVLADGPRVLGFTTTFQQSVAALALAREVRRRVPPEEVTILFGGANCEDDMGRAMADNFPFVDCVVSGEAESVVVDLVRRAIDGGAPLPRFQPGKMVSDMDALPLPDFDDYFAAVTQSGFAERTTLVAESSRGCWWGVKSHCTFCGLNGGSMAFRSKSAPRFAAELQTLSEKYGSTRFALTDNILDMGYLRTLLPDLVSQARTYQLFYETKSNLRKDQVELLAAAGATALQPGIESFSTAVLKLMGKGTTRLQNVQLLKWCAEMGVRVDWNLLFGFPGEDPADYDDMAALLPSLFHLPPPMGSAKIRLDRFGPYWKAPERYGLKNLRHYWSYDFAFAGLPGAERDRLAYFFEHDYADGREPLAYARSTADRAREWREAARAQAKLELRSSPDGPSVFDTRSCRTDEVTPLTPAGAALLRSLDGIRNAGGILAAVREQGVDIDEQACQALLADFAARRFVIEENGCWLGLVVDPEQRKRVAERRVALRAGRLGFNWPQDFPDPAQREVVRAAMLAMRPAPAVAAAQTGSVPTPA